jgi:type II secretory pathway component PulC
MPSNVSDGEYIQNDISNIKFEYKLIGYRSGGLESSVIVQKSNQEYVVSIGEKLEGIFELIEVSQDEIIFREGSKIYKIKNTVGK